MGQKKLAATVSSNTAEQFAEVLLRFVPGVFINAIADTRTFNVAFDEAYSF